MLQLLGFFFFLPTFRYLVIYTSGTLIMLQPKRNGDCYLQCTAGEEAGLLPPGVAPLLKSLPGKGVVGLILFHPVVLGGGCAPARLKQAW